MRQQWAVHYKTAQLFRSDQITTAGVDVVKPHHTEMFSLVFKDVDPI